MLTEVVKRQIAVQAIGKVSMSTKQDNFLVLHVPDEYDSVLEVVFKTEFLTFLCAGYKRVGAGPTSPAPLANSPGRSARLYHGVCF